MTYAARAIHKDCDDEGGCVVRNIVKVLTVAVVLVAMVIMTAVPAVAQGGKAKGKAKAAAKAAAAPKAIPNTGGFISPSNAALVGLGGGALLVGSGLVVRRVVRR